MTADVPIEQLPRTSAQTFTKLHHLGVTTFQDLLYHVPHRYKDYRTILTAGDFQAKKYQALKSGDESAAYVTVQGTVEKYDQLKVRNLTIQKAYINDGTGLIECVWFHQPYLYQYLKKGAHVSVSGLIDMKSGRPSVKAEEYEEIAPGKQLLHTGRLVPVYPETRGISSRTLREKIALAFDLIYKDLQEIVPADFLKTYHLMKRAQALRTIHYPTSLDTIHEARQRLGFDELFIRMLSSARIKAAWKKETLTESIVIGNTQQKLVDTFIDSLPFSLTQAQKKASDEILEDMGRKQPLNRLLQGDVGSGKTVVAAIAGYACFLNKKQTLCMAPTDILAQQHYATFSTIFDPKKIKNGPHVILHTASCRATSKQLATADIIIGTHALISRGTQFDHVGLIIIDEQHKFGVSQRAELKEKGYNPHILTMTATPIPRTVCLALYGELEVSIIDELPKGRQTIKSFVVPPVKRKDAYAWIAKTIEKEAIQAFVVCPFIEVSEAETLKSVRAVQVEYARLSKEIFPHLKVGLLHGKLKSNEKQQVMDDFARHKTDILVTTPIVEVGVDIPNANIMMIEGPERFGLAQLHQLRGRVGRGDKQAYCLLFADDKTPGTQERLEMFTRTTDGFKLAEYDLKKRGSGDLYGTKQHGIADLKFASYGDTPLLSSAQKAATDFFKHFCVEDYPALDSLLKKYDEMKIAQN